MSSSSQDRQAALDLALAFADYGFPVFSVWGIDPTNGSCLCPKGTTCTSPGKHPIPRDGLKAGSTDAERVRTMLAAAGSAGNYGVVPAEHIIVIDVDGPDWRTELAAIGLPKTLAVETANGVHLFFYWPDEYGPQPTRLFGWVVRSQEHPGYTVGPGSTHASGFVYRFAKQNGHDVHEMFMRIVNFPKDKLPSPTLETITVGPGLQPPERVGVGSRHDYLRDRARTLRGGGLTGDDLFAAVSAINRRLPEPKTDEEVRRAIGDVETKFAEDPAPIDPIEDVIEALATHPDLIRLQPDYHAENATVPTYLSPLAAYGTVSLVSGPPKSGKSTLISNLLAARQNGTVFLWGDPVPKGPMLLVTEEGGYPVVRKTVGLTELYIMDRRAFIMAGLKSLDHLLAALTSWHDPDAPALVVIDTLAVWGDIKDENDAVAVTRAITALAVWAQQTGSAVVLVHHTRKGGGDHGEAIRGSSGILALADQSIELAYTLDPKSDSRVLTIAGRLEFNERRSLVFDRDTMTYALDMSMPVDMDDLDDFPVDGSTDDGLSRQDAEKLWGLGTSGANAKLKDLSDRGLLVSRKVKLDGERAPRKLYFRPKPLLVLDNRSVGERMADILSVPDEA